MVPWSGVTNTVAVYHRYIPERLKNKIKQKYGNETPLANKIKMYYRKIIGDLCTLPRSNKN